MLDGPLKGIEQGIKQGLIRHDFPFGEHGAHFRQITGDDSLHNRFLVGEIAIDNTHAHLRFRSNVGHAGTVETGTPDTAQGRIKNMLLTFLAAQARLGTGILFCNRVTHALREILATTGI